MRLHILVPIFSLLGNGVVAKTPSKSALTVGIVFVAKEGTEYLDSAGIDIFHLLSPEYMQIIGAPKAMADKAVKMDIHWISEKGNDTMLQTGGAELVMRDSYATAPKQLDVLFIPGPNPHHVQTPAEKDFILRYANDPKTTTVLSVCTGIGPFSASGALDGHEAAGPLILLPMLNTTNPKVKWQTKRWTQSSKRGAADTVGKYWTSGGISNGLDLVAAWVRAYFWDRADAVEFILNLAEVGDRPIDYTPETLKYWANFDSTSHDAMHAGGDMSGMSGMSGVGGMSHSGR